jgi:cytochrome c5
MKSILYLLTVFLIIAVFQACGGDSSGSASNSANTPEAKQELTAFELEHGIGPVTERITMGPISEELVNKGRTIYEMKCEACHNMTGRMVGPALGDVLDRRSPEFVMNMVLRPSRMLNEHPEGQAMLREYMVAMPFQNVSQEDARAIVEFLRLQQTNN